MEPIPFRSLLLTEGVLSRDGRIIDPGALTWTCPLTLKVLLADSHGGEPGPTEIAGRIDEITRNGNDIVATGQFTTECGICEAAPMVADLTLKGISIDLAPSIVEFRAGEPGGDELGPEVYDDPPVQQTPEEAAAPPAPEVSEGEPVHRESINDMVMAVVAGEITAATIVSEPAMAASYIEIVTPTDPAAPDVPANAPADAPGTPAPAVAASGHRWASWRVTSLLAAPGDAPVPDAQPDMTGGAMICLYPPEAAALAVDGGTPPDELHITIAYLGDASTLGPDALTELDSICTELASGMEPGTGNIAGPGAFTNNDGDDPEDPAAGSDVPLVALIDSDWATDLYAAVDDALDASGIDSVTEHGFIPHMTLAYAAEPSLLPLDSADLTFPSIWLVVGTEKTEYPCGASLTASALGQAPEEPPVDWFDDPALNGPTPLTVTDDGRVYGHIATWGTCHTGFAGQCVMAPRSKSGYAYFHLGEILTASGDRVPVGQITLDTRHADLSATRRQATLHYEHTGNAVADVRAGEDRYGIWVAGAVRPETPSSTLRKFRGAKISGDWRSVKGNLELMAALAVNMPGFPVPRTQARLTASGAVTALVGPEVDPHQLDPDDAIAALALMAEHGEKTIEVLVASVGTTIDERLDEIAREVL